MDQAQWLLDDHGAVIDDAASRAGLAHGLHLIFWGVFLIAAATLALSAFVPRVAFGRKSAT